MPYCPLWSSFITYHESNNMVESYFRHVKKDILQYKLKQKPGRAVKKIKEDNDGKIAGIKLDFPARKKKKIKRLKGEPKAPALSVYNLFVQKEMINFLFCWSIINKKYLSANF